ncbi:protein Wiz isoform X2 [Thalassophryne amazonica]|uniref:protein Wiz isoform X2 n=1 Tax=Thalassophryne amazonica TaxID=390379 RepID=UPI001470A204|nr:protein Wiz isoform X2 [Thalassophryne amazonica]
MFQHFCQTRRRLHNVGGLVTEGLHTVLWGIMEPEGPPHTPGTSYGPRTPNSAQNSDASIFLNCTSEPSCSPNVRDDLMSAKCSLGHNGDETSEQTESIQPSADPGRSAQRKYKSSAFSSSLSWDSDSEKEILDEDELQHFSNPHGLAAHSPGSPSSGLRLDNEEEKQPEKAQSSHNKMGTSDPVEGQANGSTKTEGPNTPQLQLAELSESKVWNLSEGAEVFLSKVNPEDACQVEDEGGNGEREDIKEIQDSEERDVYTFPGDSDPESPPPAPWAHCTFVQRCRKKRVLLKPFSGLSTCKSTVPETESQSGLSPQKSKTAELEQLSQEGGNCDFEEPNLGGVEEQSEFTESDGLKEESGVEPNKEIFTCVECSIYFKKQIHLQEHMFEHCQSDSGGDRRDPLGKGCPFRCVECGWNLPNRLELTQHQRMHEESRVKILEEIEKLNENGKAEEIPKSDPDSAAVQEESSVLIKSPPLSPATIPTLDTEPAILASDTTPANSFPTQPQSRAVSYRRRFFCSKCNFSTRTSQALSNHAKTHNRRKTANTPSLRIKGLVDDHALSRSSTLRLAPSSLACAHCAFVTQNPSILRQHQKLVHPGDTSISRPWSDVISRHSKSGVGALISNSLVDSDHVSGSGSTSTLEGSQQEVIIVEDSTEPEGDPDKPAGEVFKITRRSNRRGKDWTEQDTFQLRLEDNELSGSDTEQDEHQSTDLPQKESPVRLKPHTRAQSRTDDCSSQPLKDEEKQKMGKDSKVPFLRRSSRVTAASAKIDSDDDDGVDAQRMRRFLSKSIWIEDKDETDDDAEMLKSVERKCPYCPDRFHNGIGLANHVRGHLNRVGVSYNVRHFISPEEVNAIEKKFSYQKKKKKVANFDPDTFSVMHCEFCSAGFDTRAGLSSHARAHLRDFGITNWDVTISPIHILRELFPSRPELEMPTSSLQSSEDDEDDEEIIEIKLEGESGERSPSTSNVPNSASPHPWKTEDEENCEGDEEEAAEEEEDKLLIPPLDGVSLRATRRCESDRDSLSPQQDADAKVHNLKCRVCGAQFETKRGLSSHARSHLRQLGITISESSGAPIALLYQIAKERNLDGKLGSPLQDPASANNSSSPRKDEDLEDEDDMDLDEKLIPLSLLTKAAKAVPPSSSSSSTPTPSPGGSPPPIHSGSPSAVVRKAPISSLLPVSSPLRSPEHKAGGMKSLTSNVTKPIWAPQEDDAPLNLTLEMEADKDIVCQLCGAWFETRKGLSSHARAHLRHFGVEYSESKGSPIDLLNHLIDTDDFKHKANELQLESHVETHTLSPAKQSHTTLSSSLSSSLLYKMTTCDIGSTSKATSSTASSLLGPSAKRPKSSSMQVFRLSSGELMALPHSDPPKEIGCEYCGEYFENRKGLSSHARSHLRQMGITEWSVNGSPIDTLREIMTRRGLPSAIPAKALRTPPPSSPGPPRSPLSSSSSPSASVLNRVPFAFARPSSPQPVVSKSSSVPPPTTSSGLILKLKPEPVQLEVTAPATVGRSTGFSAQSHNSSWNSSDSVFPLNLAVSHQSEPTRDIRCEFCGEYFENRKGLSSHARSHLRQMGITQWSVNGSPIDTLREVMRKKGLSTSSRSDQGVKKESGQGANSPSWERLGSSDGLGIAGYQSSRFRKSSLTLLHSGSRFHKQSLGSAGTSVPSAPGKFFRMSPLGKRILSEEGSTVESTHSSPNQLKTFSSSSNDVSFRRKVSPDKHAHQDPSCELCGFFFENRKALASHARAHLRQFGVTEWCVNGSPIETLSAWIRSRPQKVVEMHRSYMQGNRSIHKKTSSSSSQWSSSTVANLVRSANHDINQSSSKTGDREAGTESQAPLSRADYGRPGSSQLSGVLPLQAQVARSELNVRLPRGFERRPLKHPSCSDGGERDSGPPKVPRTSTVPALVPKPPAYPLVKLVGKVYTLKCRFCEVEFHGPLSVQEDWIRHLQQHIVKMNYNKPAALKAASTEPTSLADDLSPGQPSTPASTSTSSTSSSTPVVVPVAVTPTPNSHSPTPLAERAPTDTATETEQISQEQPTLTETPVPLPTPIV